MLERPRKVNTRLLPLALGAVAGLALAAAELVEHWPALNGTLPDSAVARVGERYIPRSRFAQLLSDLEADKRAPLTGEDRQFVLDRLVDEELLILRGMELGLPESSPLIRKAIAAAMIAQVATETDARPPDEKALRELYESDPDFFAVTGRYQLRWWRLPLSGEDTRTRAAAAVLQLDMKVAEQEVERSTGLRRETILPEQLLPLSKLTDYLGPELAEHLPRLQPGKYSRPIEADGSVHVLFLVDRRAQEVPAFEQLRPVVEAEFQRRAGDKAFRDYSPGCATNRGHR
jgi:hypothetical protein